MKNNIKIIIGLLLVSVMATAQWYDFIGQIQWDTGATKPAYTKGMMFWNSLTDTVSYYKNDSTERVDLKEDKIDNAIYARFDAENRDIADFTNFSITTASPLNGEAMYSVHPFPASIPDVVAPLGALGYRNTVKFKYKLGSGQVKATLSGGGIATPVEAILDPADNGRALIEYTPTSQVPLKLTFTEEATVVTFRVDDIVFIDREKEVEWFIKNSAFTKIDSRSVAFIKTGASTASVKAGTFANVNGVEVTFGVDTAIVMPTLIAGTDYAIYICQDGTIRASDNFSAPSGYTTTSSTKVGGFHFSAIPTTETVVSGEFATTGGGMIWTQPDVDKIRGINEFSFWDKKFRPKANDPRGMVLVAGQFWADIYFTNTDVDTNGTSKYGSDIASGTVLAKRPAMFGGDGTATYADGNWWNLAELVRSQGKRLPTFNEFSALAFGTTEATSLGGAAVTIPLTKREKKYTSKWGVEQSTGHIYTWGADIGGYAGGSSWAANTQGRGSTYALNLSAPLFGGYRTVTANSGSRSSSWVGAPTNSHWSVGVRAVCDHVITD